MVVEKKLYTVEEFESFSEQPENRDRHFELINGEIVEKAMPNEVHGLIVGNIYGFLWLYVRKTKRGRVVSEVLHRVPSDPHNERQPDISYFTDNSRPVVTKGAVLQTPDLIVEVKSPSNTYREMLDKSAYYLANGAKMVWLAYPEKRIIEVHTPTTRDILTENDTLTGGDLLPDFSLPLKDIFEM